MSSNLRFLNSKAKMYHDTLLKAQDDLITLVCEDLSPEPLVLTKEAYAAFKATLGRRPHMAVPTDPLSATFISDRVLTTEDLEGLKSLLK